MAMGPLRCEIFFVIEFAETGSSFSESINVHWMPGYLIGMLGLPEGHKASQTHNCWKEILQAKEAHSVEAFTFQSCNRMTRKSIGTTYT